MRTNIETIRQLELKFYPHLRLDYAANCIVVQLRGKFGFVEIV